MYTNWYLPAQYKITFYLFIYTLRAISGMYMDNPYKFLYIHVQYLYRYLSEKYM